MTADNLNNMRVIPDLLAINEKVRPNKVAYRQFDDKSKTWISVTWKEFADMVRSWRKAFTASGLSKGDHAAVLLPNSITATACDLSILSQGMVPVPLHAVDTPSSSAFILNNSEAKILFVPRTLRWNAMLNAQKEYPYLKLVVTTGNDAEGASEDSPVPVVNLSDWLKQGENTDLKEVSIDPDDLAAIVYTSGTTGKPKGVMLTHDNVLSNVKSFSQVIDVGSDDVFLSFLPFSHTFERTVTFYFTLFLGAEVGFARSVLKLAEDLKIAPGPAQTLTPGLPEGRRLLVIEHRRVAVAYLPAAHHVVDREFNVLGQQEEVPAAALVQHLLREQEARAGDGAARAQLHARVVQELRLAQKPQRIARGYPVVPEVLAVAVARHYLIAVREDLVHLLYIVLLEHVVRVEDEVAVERPLGEELVYLPEQEVERIALADPRGVEALEDYGPGLGRYRRRRIRTVVSHDKGRHEPQVVGLPPHALDEVRYDGLLVARRNQHRIPVPPDRLRRLVLYYVGDQYVQKLIGITYDKNDGNDIVYHFNCIHKFLPSRSETL